MAELHEAQYWEQLENNQVHCTLCPHNCHISEGKRGRCRVRENHDGTLYSLIYGQITSAAIDPIEKKPLYHFHPGSTIFSLGTTGCNFACQFCQNYTIAQMEAPTQPFSSEEAIAAAIKHKSIGIAYTYNEPFIWWEFVHDTAQMAREHGLKNVLVTNGYVQEKPLLDILPFIDALNIDIKSMRPEFYEKIVRGTLEPVLRTCELAAKQALTEITNLVIPDYNDSDQDFQELASWVAEHMGRQTPAHLSAYYPCYKLQARPTPAPTLLRAYGIFKQHLDYVYLGNLSIRQGSDTTCKSCGAVLVERLGFSTKIVNLAEDGSCGKCGAENNIVV